MSSSAYSIFGFFHQEQGMEYLAIHVQPYKRIIVGEY